MDGLYEDSNGRHRDVIRAWMKATIRSGGIERYDDLHIDRIDTVWRSQRLWITGGLKCLGTALQLRDEEEIDATVTLAFSLNSKQSAEGVDFTNAAELEQQLNGSPPSLYLFHRGSEPWSKRMLDPQVTASTIVQEIDSSVLGSAAAGRRCVYMEFFTDGEYSRSIFVF